MANLKEKIIVEIEIGEFNRLSFGAVPFFSSIVGGVVLSVFVPTLIWFTAPLFIAILGTVATEKLRLIRINQNDEEE